MCKQNFSLPRWNNRNCRCALCLDPTFSIDCNAMVARWSYSQGSGLAIHRFHRFPTLSPPPTTHPTFTFRPASESEISRILHNCPNNQSDSDPIPTWLLKQCSSVLTPIITNVVNLSLSSGNFHSTLKESTITPILKNQLWIKKNSQTTVLSQTYQ